MRLRGDITGLRAIAILSVVIFHFNSTLLPGGFAGVDIFFVISGYLMTKIIVTRLDNHTFSLCGFYVDRLNRIVPALAFLCLTLLVFGWFYLTPIDYQVLAKHISTTIEFYSNITYKGESGYFNAAANEKWLLHSWSLSVEWQFYLLYPILLMLFTTLFNKTYLKYILLVLTLVGFGVCISISLKKPETAYFVISTRVWEMMFGGLIILFPMYLSKRQVNLLTWSGLAFIFVTFFWVSSEDIWPGYWALLPVLGTFFIILANKESSMLTRYSLFQSLGKWSYSIYLWHWPIVVFGYYFSFDNWIFIGLPLSIFLGWLSFHYIESISFKRVSNWRYLLTVKPIWMIVMIAIMSWLLISHQGVSSRYMPDKVDLVKQLSDNIVMPHRGNGYCFYSFNDDKKLSIDKKLGGECTLGDLSKKPNTLLFGDSFAGHNDPFWDIIFKDNKMAYQSVSTNWCYPAFNDHFTGPKKHPSYQQCLLNRQLLKEAIENKDYDNIIFAGSWSSVDQRGWLADFEQVVREASKKAINVFVMPIPTPYRRNPIQPFFNSIYKESTFDLTVYEGRNTNPVNEKMKTLFASYDNVYFIEQDWLFEKTKEFCFMQRYVPYTLDGNHISLLGAQQSAQYFMSSIQYQEVMGHFLMP